MIVPASAAPASHADPPEDARHAAGEALSQRLRESEAALRAFYENAPVCMGITELVDDASEVLHVDDNPATCRFFGLAPGATRGKRAGSELGADPRVVERWIQAYREAEATGTPTRFEHEFPTPGGPRWLAATVSVIGTGPHGRTRFSYIAEDVTQRREAEHALRDSEQRLRLALEAGRMGTWEWHVPSGRVSWSPGLEAIHGYEPGTFPGTVEAYNAEVHPDDRAYVQDVITRTMSGEDHLIEYRIVRRDGAVRWVEGRGKLFTDKGGQPLRLVGVCSDVTPRKDAEQRLREADRRKDEFLATLAHELRNPLAPLRTGLELFRRRTLDRPDLAPLGDMMERQLRHMVRLIDDLLDVSRITRGRIALQARRIDLVDVIREVMEASQGPFAARRQRLVATLPGAPVALDGDATRLAQVLSNLLNNASKFTPAGGTIEVRLRTSANEACVDVIDDGIGIDGAMLERIFGLFVQVDASMTKTQPGLASGLHCRASWWSCTEAASPRRAPAWAGARPSRSGCPCRTPPRPRLFPRASWSPGPAPCASRTPSPPGRASRGATWARTRSRFPPGCR